MQHHEAALSAFVTEVADRPSTLAVVLVGSVARGLERPDSDVDVYLVVTDEELERAVRARAVGYTRDELTDDDVYVDVKLASPTYLRAVAERGSEPARASFVGARIAWSRLEDLPSLLDATHAVPRDQWDERVLSFTAEARIYGGYFLPQAAASQDAYLLHWAAVHLVGSACRALLAHAHVTFAGAKYLRLSVGRLEGLPDGFLQLTDRLLDEPTPELGIEVMRRVEGVVRAPLGMSETIGQFVVDNELSWWTGLPAPEAL